MIWFSNTEPLLILELEQDKNQLRKSNLNLRMQSSRRHKTVRLLITVNFLRAYLEIFFLNSFLIWSLGVHICESEFLEYYADVNATLPKEKEEYFVDIILSTWGITSSVDYVSPERLADLEVILYEKIRQKTFTKEDEGKTAYKAFKYFDLVEKGVVAIQQFKQTLDKFGCVFTDKEIQALFNKFDT